MELEGRKALVTGAGSLGGIGADIAMLLASEGAEVYVTGRDLSRGQRVVDSITDTGGRARFLFANLADPEDVSRLADDATGVDVLVNNAGVYSLGSSLELTPEAFDQMYRTNVQAPYFLIQKLVPAMLTRGWGSIVNVTSIAAKIAVPGMSIYGSTKAAMESHTRYWAAEFADRNVRVNAVAPGTIASDNVMAVARANDIEEQLRDDAPMKRIASVREISEVVLFLASNRARFITGSVVTADGGRTIV